MLTLKLLQLGKKINTYLDYEIFRIIFIFTTQLFLSQALKETMKRNASNTSVRDRIQAQINQAEEALASILN